MGEFAFARSFGMLKNAQWHEGVALLRQGMSLLGYMSPAPWLGQVAISIPLLPAVHKWNAMVKWCESRMAERLEVCITE